MTRPPSWSSRVALAAILAVGVLLSTRGILDETHVSLDGDMPHYLLNGVFLADVLRDAPLLHPLEYAQRYYARYPGITLGHHPLLPTVLAAPFHLILGASVFAGRATVVLAFVAALWFWYRLVRDVYDTPTAVFASLLLITTPGISPLFQVVLSEPYTLCFIIMSVYFMHRYCQTERRGMAIAFALSVVASAYAKHLAVLLFPVYLFQFVRAFGVRRLFRPSTVLFVAAIAVCLLPVAALTLKYSQWNVTIVTQIVRPEHRLGSSRLLRFLSGLWGGQFRLSMPLLAVATTSIAVALVRRDWRILLFVGWVCAIFGGIVAIGLYNERVFCYWVAAWCAIGAATLQIGGGRSRIAIAVVLSAVVAYQSWLGLQASATPLIAGVRPAGAAGYEEAARYVIDNRSGDTVLYSAGVDSGYFVFFVRKHDPDRRMVILRADKMLTTSRMGNSNFRREVNAREEIPLVLKRFGVRHVVIEDRPQLDGPLRWLQDLVETADFELLKRIPVKSTDLRLTGATISLYAYRGYQPADEHAAFSIGIPMMNDQIELPLSELTRSHGR